jgi:hypothetical protein
MKRTVKRGFRVLALFAGGSLLLCAIVAALSAASNRSLPTGPGETDRLSSLDQARLAEALHLKQALGERVWPGWGRADIPVLIWIGDHSLLVGHPAPPAGWEPVPGDAFQGQPYYRRATGEPQNFAIRVGDRWVASMAAKWEVDAFMIEMIGDTLPPPLRPVFPYRLLIQPSEVQISGVLHESFHVYQAQVSPARLEEAEKAHSRGKQYWQVDAAMRQAWRLEIDLLASALEAESSQEAAALVRRFLDQRAQRRAAHGAAHGAAHDLDAALIDYERQLEWEEGLAKYVELATWREAYAATDYEPLPAMADDPDFGRYATFPRRWSQEIGQMKRQASREGETRFYYTGMAQAMLLDRLLPGWQERIWANGVWLETLLAEATEQP